MTAQLRQGARTAARQDDCIALPHCLLTRTAEEELKRHAYEAAATQLVALTALLLHSSQLRNGLLAAPLKIAVTRLSLHSPQLPKCLLVGSLQHRRKELAELASNFDQPLRL